MEKTQTPEEIAQAIRGSICIGPGYLRKLAVNGKIEFEKLVWLEYCVLDPLYGGCICDNTLYVRIGLSDKWTVEHMETTIVVNSVDQTLIKGNVDELKRKTAKKGKIINL